MSDPNMPPPPPSAPPPPPGGGWQSQPQQPGPPPMGSGMPSWTGNITARGTIAGPGGLALADLTDRIIALIIDSLIIGVAGFILAAILGSVLVETRTEVILGIPVTVRGPSTIAGIATLILLAVLNAGYYIYQWSRMNGQTVGMKVMKVGVRDAATGGPVSQQQAINRWLVLGAPLLLYWIPFVGFIASLVALGWYIYLLYTTAQDPMRQGFHDKFAKTVVAKLAM